MTHIGPGTVAPDFSATSHDGRPIRLSSFRGAKPVVIFFYPMNRTPICTREACQFRDAYEAFLAAGAEVIGVSGDSVESHQRFAASYRLPFPLVSDADGAIRRAFGVSRTLGFLPGRVTFVIDKQGLVRHMFRSQFAAGKHVAEALAVLERLAQEAGQ